MKAKKVFSYFLAVTLVMGVFCAVPAQAATANTVTFDGSGYDLADEMWTVTKDGTAGTFGTDAALAGAEGDVTPHSGTKMVKVTGEAGKTVELKKVFEVEPQKNYAASVWMYSNSFVDDTEDAADGVKLSVKDAEGNLMWRGYGSGNVPFPGQTSETGCFVANKAAWRKMYVYVHGANANRNSVEMVLSFRGAGTVYFDDIVIEEAPLIPNGDFEGLTSDFVPAVWVPTTAPAAYGDAATFSDPDTIPEYTEEGKKTYPYKGYNYTYLRTEEGREGQHLAIAEAKKAVQIFPISLEAGAKYKLTMDYQASLVAKQPQLMINHKLSSDDNPFMQGNKISQVFALGSSGYAKLPAKVGEWVNGFEYYFTMSPKAVITTNAFIQLYNYHAGNMFKIDNVKLEKLEDVPTVSITKNGEAAGKTFSGGATAKVTFRDPYAELTWRMSQPSENANTAYIYEGEEKTMVVAAYTEENGVRQLVECKVVKGKAESSTLLYEHQTTADFTTIPTPDSKWCHGEVPLELETEITFGQEGDGKTYELEAFFIGENLKPMYKPSELVYN